MWRGWAAVTAASAREPQLLAPGHQTTSLSTPRAINAVSGARNSGNTRRGCAGDPEPGPVGVGVVNAMPRQEVACHIGTVDLEGMGEVRLSARSARGRENIASRRRAAQIGCSPRRKPGRLRRRTPAGEGMVEQRVVFDIENELG